MAVSIEGHGARLDALTIKVAALESKSGTRVDVTVVKADTNVWKKEVAKLKYIDIISLWGSVDVPLETAIGVTRGLRLRMSILPFPQRLMRRHWGLMSSR